jgi:competence protein ComEC
MLPAAVPAPLVAPTVGVIGGIVVSDACGVLRDGIPWSFGAALIGILLLVVERRVRANRRWIVATGALFILGTGVGFARHQLAIERPARHVCRVLKDGPVLTRVTGRVVNTPTVVPPVKRNPFVHWRDPSPTVRFLIDVEAVGAPATPATGRLKVTVVGNDAGLHFGDRVRLTGWLRELRPPMNPGARDWARWYRLQGVDASLTVPDVAHVAVRAPASGWAAWVAALRTRALAAMHAPYADTPTDDDARLLEVMVLGQRSRADQELNDAFARVGGMHFLAMSGFHVGVLAALLAAIGRWVLRLGPRGTALLTAAGSLLLLLIVEPNAPIVRAVVLVVVGSIALALGRSVNLRNWVALAALVLMINPNELFRAGFQLTFIIVIALIAAAGPVYRWLWRRLLPRTNPDLKELPAETWPRVLFRLLAKAALGLLAASLVAWVAALPLVLFHFGRLHPWGWLTATLLAPLAIATITVGALHLLIAALTGGHFAPLAAPLDWVTRLFLGAVDQLGQLPASELATTTPPIWLVAATYGVLAAWWLWPATAQRPARRVASRAAKGTAAGVLMICWLGWVVLPDGGRGAGHAVWVLAVGNGSATIVTAPGEPALIYDVGTIANFDAGAVTSAALRGIGVRHVDRVVLSHANFDHFSGLPKLAAEMPARRWCISPHFPWTGNRPAAVRELARMLPPKMPPPERVAAGATWPVAAARCEVLWPPAELPGKWTPNDRSIVLRIEIAGRRILLTGDAHKHALDGLVAQHESGELDLGCDVLVAPHHGALLPDATAAFLEATAPVHVIVSARRRRPRFEALVRETLGAAVPVYTTGVVGAVVARVTRDGTLRIETPWSTGAVHAFAEDDGFTSGPESGLMQPEPSESQTQHGG